jgi:pimeloyl-ACP methyl ester carboxylesterase
MGVEEHGAGLPLVWLPGTPGSRLWKAPFVPDGVRLLVVERPGFGASDPAPGYGYLDWPAILEEVADHFGLDRFALAGTSGAGPYLQACGVRLAHRVRKLGLIACVGPPEMAGGLPAWRRWAQTFARLAPRVMAATLPRSPEAFYRLLTRDVPPCDGAIVSRIWASQVEATAEALRQGPEAFVHELASLTRPWGFTSRDVRADVVLWHGSEDRAAPVDGAKRLAQRLPTCTAHLVEGAGHFLHYDRWQAVLDSLLG